MSSTDDDELGTSHVSKTPRIAQKATRGTRNTKPDNLASQTESRRVHSTKASTSRGSKDDPMDIDLSDGRLEEVEQQPHKRTTENARVHGLRSTKGKARAGTRSAASAIADPIKEVLVIGDDGNAGQATANASQNPASTVNHTSQRTTKSRPNADSTAVAKLKGELVEARTENSTLKTKNSVLDEENIALKVQCDKLTGQLDELFSIRHTEAEQLWQDQTQIFQARIETQQKTIQELTSNLARVEPLSRSGTVLHLLTRDAADEEKRALEDDLARLRQQLAEKDGIIADHEKWREEQLQEAKELRYELHLSREALSKNNSTKATLRSRSDDPKYAVALKFYEDVSDVMIIGVEHQGHSKYMQLDEWSLNCLYTHSDATNPTLEGYSLNFSLRTQWDPHSGTNPPYTSEKQLKQTLHYNPLLLQDKSDIVEKLDFLKTPFTFERTQLPVFLRTLRDTVAEALSLPEGEDADESRTAIEITD